MDLNVLDCRTTSQSVDPEKSPIDGQNQTRDFNDHVVINDQVCGVLYDFKGFEYKIPTDVPECQANVEDDSSIAREYDGLLNHLGEDFQAAKAKAFEVGATINDTVDTIKSQVQDTTELTPISLLVVDDKVAVEIDHTQEIIEIQSFVEHKPVVVKPLPVEEPKILLQVEEKATAIQEAKEKKTEMRHRLSAIHKHLLRSPKERQTYNGSGYISFNHRRWGKNRRKRNER
jgi:hypothetical protein